MIPFPHFPYLPPATPEQAAAILRQLRPTSRILAFDRTEDTLAWVRDGYVAIVYILLATTGFSVRVRDWTVRRVRRGGLFAQGVVAFAILDVALAILGLPLSSYGWHIARAYALSKQTYGQWLIDHAKFVGTNLIIDSLVCGLLLVLIRKSPRKWPAWFAAMLAPIIAFAIFLEPVLIDPLYNHFALLPVSSPLYTPIHDLADRAGIGSAAIYVADKSRQTTETNAYVTGFGPSLRIVIWDTLIARMDRREVLAIVAHEMGHYVEGHLIIGCCLAVIGLFALLPLIRLMAIALVNRFGPRWQIRALHDPAAIPLLLLSLQIGLLITQPGVNAVSRWIEHRADAYSLGLNRDRIGLAQSFVDLSKQDLDNPYPSAWDKFWFYDHPPLGERVRFALDGEP